MIRPIGKTNGLIKLAAKLFRDSSARRETGLFALEGERLCAEALRSGIVPETVFLTEKALAVYADAAGALADAAGQAFLIDERIADVISDVRSPQGVFALCPMIGLADPASISPDGLYLALDRVQDPSNLGACARTAEALGFDGLIASGGCDVTNPKALRASMGSLLRLPLYTPPALAPLLGSLRVRGMRVCVSVIDSGAVSVFDADKTGGIVLVIGNEGSGVSDTVVSEADVLFTISMYSAAAATVMMWEFAKARRGS